MKLYDNVQIEPYFQERVNREKKKEGKKDTETSNQEWDNLSAKERRGLIKLRKRVKSGEIAIIKTDKSGKLGIICKD